MIINDDCLNYLPNIQDNSIDLILCDIPYGTTACSWDSVIDMDRLWSEYWRVAKPDAAIVLTAAQPFTSMLVASQVKHFKYEWIWQKPQGVGFLTAKHQPLKNHESVLVFYKKKPTYNPQMRTGFKPYVSGKKNAGDCYGGYKGSEDYRSKSEGDRYPVTILEFPRDKEKLHPTQKPVALMEYMIKTYTNAGDVVLDNCMGSGTTAIAALNTGRRFVGIEQDKAYFEIASERIKNHVQD